MEQLYIDVQKGRKGVTRVDIKSKKKNKLDKLAEDLGVENFKQDLVIHTKVKKSEVDLVIKANNGHLPEGAERHAYTPTTEYGIVYIPVNRLKQVYQTDAALNRTKINENKAKMKSGTPLDPIEIGYNYDVHDGHHRWVASQELGYTHVPCKVVGDDYSKVLQARKEYRKVWKSIQTDSDEFLVKSLNEDLQQLVSSNGSIDEYGNLVDVIQEARPIIEGVLGDGHYENVSQVLNCLNSYSGDTDTADDIVHEAIKSLTLVVDLQKAGHELHKGRLVRRRVMVKGKNGKTHYRMQWIDPNKDKEAFENSEHPGSHETTYQHHEEGISDLEHRQSNKFPVRHMETNRLKNTIRNYRTDKEAYNEALKKYHNGEPLPVVKVSPEGEILEHEEIVDMAKHLGLSHVPVIIMGNSKLKKQVEDELKDPVYAEQEDAEPDETGKKPLYAVNKKEDRDAGLPSEIVRDLDHFRDYISHIYPHSYVMEQAKKQDIVWAEYTKNGVKLGENSNILWMNASKAIQEHISDGNPFIIDADEKQIDERMTQDKKDPMQKYFMKLLHEKFKGDRQELMEYCKKHQITWKENKDPSKNWMNAMKAIKSALAKGQMINGVRTRKKGAMEEANLIVSDQVKDQVKAMGRRYGKIDVCMRAVDLGIVFNMFDRKGNMLGENSSILWMRASEAIQKYIAQGNTFTMGNEAEKGEDGIKATVGDHGAGNLSYIQKYALDWAKRNSQKREEKIRQYTMKAFKVDRGITGEEASHLYEKFQENARNAKYMVHFDPFEKLPNGVNLIDQLTSDGEFKNDYYLNRGWDKEHREANESYVFGRDFNQADDKDRPTYGGLDLYNKGLGSNPYSGNIAFVLKKDDDIVKRSTGIAIDSDNVPFGEEGQWVRSLEDPHQLLVDRWRAKWKNPNKADGQRKRAMDAVIDGTPNMDDISPFEAHVFGGINFQKDVDHILLPSSWQTDKQHKDKHNRMKEFSKLMNIPIKYE